MANKTSKKTKNKNKSGWFKKIFTFNKREDKVKLHKSFKRSYREDYKRELEVPGIMYHIFASLRMILKNWKLFLPFLILSVIASIVFVGLMSESTYQKFQEVMDQTSEELGQEGVSAPIKAILLLVSTVTTGGLSGSSSEAAMVFVVIIFIIMWLTTIFLVRHLLAERKVKLRDALYNAMTPLISTLVVVLVIILQCIPIFILIIVYSAAVQTEFLATPFYALVFFIFAAVMLLLSGYLLSSSLMALVAVTVPGMYPMQALNAASDLMAGRRTKFIIRLIAGFISIIVIWLIVMFPLIMFDLFMKQFEWTAGIPFVPVCLLIMTCFTVFYVSVYLYMYYRWMLNYDEK